MKSRILTSVVAIPLVLAVVGCTNPWPLAVVLLAVLVWIEVEAASLFDESPGGPALMSAVGFLVLFGGLVRVGSLQNYSAEPGLVALIASVFFPSFLLGPIAFNRSRVGSRVAFGAWAWTAVISLMVLQTSVWDQGWSWSLRTPLLLLLLPVWAGDIAAMLGGMAFGKHPLAPKISPNKTWEGAIANFLAATLVGWGVGAWLGYEPWVGPACGAAVGVFGQLGDLFESALKRSVGKKDSGNLLPGHGGLLDRIDALLGSVIPVWLILYLSGSV